MSSGIPWHFNPPLASHFGGIFQIIIKAMKRAMKAIIGRADLDKEELRTSVSKNVLLDQLKTNPSGQWCQRLWGFNTPYHFLLPDLAGAVLPPIYKEGKKLKLSTRLIFQIEIQKHIWKRFQEEVILMLGPRKSGQKKHQIYMKMMWF